MRQAIHDFQAEAKPARSLSASEGIHFHLLLVAVALAAVVPALRIGASQFIHYDGYWHLFTATQDKWSLFLSEWRADAHPPLYYLLLRWCAKVGQSRLIYRLPSILPGAASVYLIGTIGRRLFFSVWSSLLAALAYGLSITMIDMFCDVRGYPLALFFVIAAFACLVRSFELSDLRQLGRSLVGWSVFVSFGILTEYYVAFFWVACLAISAHRALRDWDYRYRMSDYARAQPVTSALVMLLPCCTAAWLYYVHLRYQVQTENNVAQFYWAPGTPIGSFLWSGLQADLTFLSPLHTQSPALLATTALCLLAAAVYLAVAGNRSSGSVARSSPAQLLLFLLFELAVLSLLRRYPLGGFARQQSIIFPFIILSGLGFIDAVLERVSYAWFRWTMAAGVAMLIAMNFVHNWRRFPRISQELFTETYIDFRDRLPDVGAVYVDQFSLIAYYTHTHDWQWKFKEHLRCPERVDVYETTDTSGKRTLLLRNVNEWNFDLLRRSTYDVLSAALHRSNLKQVNLFYFKQGGELTHRDIGAEKRQIHQLAAEAGLKVSPTVYNNAEGLMTFRLE